MGTGPAASPTIQSIARALADHVDPQAQADLRGEYPAHAVERHFAPLGCAPFPSTTIAPSFCSIDGCYVADIDATTPWILYADDVHKDRIRFTIVHELGHHLLATVAARLLNDIDVVGGARADDAIHTEEAVCHHFAGLLLVPDDILEAVIRNERITPRHVAEIHERASASWEATAVRIAGAMPSRGAVVLLRDDSRVSFCASSYRMGSKWWARGSLLKPGGPLSRGFRLVQTAVVDEYRFDLSFAEAMFCDTLPIHNGLAIGALGERPSDGSLSIIEQPEPSWKNQEEFCEWHPGVVRDVGWCFKCRGRRCPECFRCGCNHPVQSPLCPKCGLIKPFRKGAAMCRDCEQD